MYLLCFVKVKSLRGTKKPLPNFFSELMILRIFPERTPLCIYDRYISWALGRGSPLSSSMERVGAAFQRGDMMFILRRSVFEYKLCDKKAEFFVLSLPTKLSFFKIKGDTKKFSSSFFFQWDGSEWD